MFKQCISCNEIKNLTDFYIKDKFTGRLSSKCKICDCEYNKKTRQTPEFKEKNRNRSRLRYETDLEFRKNVSVITTKSYLKLKYGVLEKYGGTCNCCGEKFFEFLSIDHVNGGGAKDLIKGTASFLRKLKNSEISEDYRVLCRNCNQSLGYYGYCPHCPNIIKEDVKTWWAERYKNLRKSVLELYGNKCDCCGVDFYEFLAIDHVKGNGAEERRKLTPERFLSKLMNIGIKSSDYRILCHNCNSSFWYSGYCPHQNKGYYEQFI